jgi:hypothetical protein
MMNDIHECPEDIHDSGVLVTAQAPGGRFVLADVMHLTHGSILRWLVLKDIPGGLARTPPFQVDLNFADRYVMRNEDPDPETEEPP